MAKKTFEGGAHPPEFKHYSENSALETLPAPESVIVPVIQHLGAPATPLVAKKDEVKMGQKLADPGGFVSVPCHSPVSGTVKNVKNFPHPFGRSVLAVEITNDGEDTPDHDMSLDPDYLKLSPDEMKNRIKEAGLAGMGGAAFPTHVKLSPPAEYPIDTTIINGAECEPYLTADHRVMLEQGLDVLKGLEIINKILQPKQSFIGIESNKPDAFKVMTDLAKDFPGVDVVMLPVKYPQGAEKQLISALTGREVPSGGLPMNVGCLVHNVGTAVSIYEAVAFNKPLMERVVTVTGPGIKTPKNIRARIGTMFADLIEFAGGYNDGVAKLISGGPMMGMALHTDMVPVIKGTSGILVLDEKTAKLDEPKPCIACSRCLEVCPMKLTPTLIATYVEYDRIEEAGDTHILDCIECGSCTYICPTKRNLVHLIKVGKIELGALRRKQKEEAAKEKAAMDAA